MGMLTNMTFPAQSLGFLNVIQNFLKANQKHSDVLKIRVFANPLRLGQRELKTRAVK
jgi:hypothetical protein